MISCISCFFLSFGNSESAMIALLCLFGGISIASWNALDVLTVELYPSDKRWVKGGGVLGGRWRASRPRSLQSLLRDDVSSDVTWVAQLRLVASEGGMTLGVLVAVCEAPGGQFGFWFF